MSKSLHEAIQQVQEKVAPNVQTRIGSTQPVIYDTKRGGTPADIRRERGKVLKFPKTPISQISRALARSVQTDSVEHDGDTLSETDFHKKGLADRVRARIRYGKKGENLSPEDKAAAEKSINRKEARSKTIAGVPPTSANTGRRQRVGTKRPPADPNNPRDTGRVRDQSIADYHDEARRRGYSTESSDFSDRVLQGASDILEARSDVHYIVRAGRLGKSIEGRATQAAKAEPGSDKKDRLMRKLSRSRSKLISLGGDASSEKIMGDITRERLGLKK